MNQEKKRELSQLLSKAMQYIDIQAHSSKSPNINVDHYKQLLHNEWAENQPFTTRAASILFQPYITEETINANLLNFMREELSKYINVDNIIGVSPHSNTCEFRHLRTQLLRIAIYFGVEYAVNEFNRCLTDNSETIQHCTILNGIRVDNEIQV